MVSELRKSLRENSDVLDEMEEQIEDETPALFLDYAAASEEDRAMLDVSRVTLKDAAFEPNAHNVCRLISKSLEHSIASRPAVNGTASAAVSPLQSPRCLMTT